MNVEDEVSRKKTTNNFIGKVVITSVQINEILKTE